MNFLNFLTSGASLFSSNLQQPTQAIKKTNHILIEAQPEKSEKKNTTTTNMPQIGLNEKSNFNQPDQEQLSKMLINQQQLLITQFLQLNYLKNAQSLASMGVQPLNLPEDRQEDRQKIENSRTKKIKKENKCGHQDRAHYAKGMCNNCYHKYGRTKKPWNCPHNKLYAAGMCQNCYINNYNRKKREEKNINQSSIEDRDNFQGQKKIPNSQQQNK